MYSKIEGGTSIIIQGLECWIPPVGYVINITTKQLEHRGVWQRSNIKEEQYWERTPLPSWYKAKMKEEDAYEKRKKDDDPSFYDQQLEDYKKQEWDRRLNGMWYMNNGVPTYIVGSHYMYMQWWQLDTGYPRFRVPDLEYFYFLQYCIEDPDCMGMLEITKRRFGKTYRGGLFLYEYPTRTRMTNAGIQSKTGNDAKKVFSKAVITPFKKLPKFFRPEYDMSLGITPKTEIRFQQTNIRGKKAEDNLDKEELGSMIDHQSADIVAYDGQKIQRYFGDEWAKCFGKGTPIRMYDGSVKKVEEIVDGDIVMGADSYPRVAYGITRGIEEMYTIVPKKGGSWVCNKSHILSLKWCLGKANKKRGWAAKSVVNISVRDFLNLSKGEQRHLMLYKAAVEYPAKKNEIEPYFLGLWLGDGSKDTPEITTADREIVEYLKDLATTEGLNLINTEHIQYRLSCKRSISIKGTVDGTEHSFSSVSDACLHFGYAANFYQTQTFKEHNWEIKDNTKNRLLSAMRKYGIINNKHIPVDYLIDSRENRLKLLAGLIDSDGYLSVGAKNKKPKSFEITQKIERLAYQIQELATSLGFYSSVNPKIATMRRKDKSIYKCPVYKVLIYGDLWLIPTRVERKKVKKQNFHINRRTASHCGFSIMPNGLGEYYGFAVDGDHLFLLEDGTVVHNTTEVNIYDRHEVIRYCLMDDEGKIIGKALYSSTVEKLETDRDGIQQAAKTLWDDSDQLNKQENGRTPSGLYRYFMSADRSRNFDLYGYPDVEKTIKEILADRESVKHNSRTLMKRIKKEARTIEEAFSDDDEGCIFDLPSINAQKQYLRDNPINYWRYVQYYRDLDQEVKCRDVDPSKTELYWKSLSLPNADQKNKSHYVDGIKKPGRIGEGVIGVDGYSNTQGGKVYGSKLSGWIFLKFDIRDPENTGLFIGHIYGRPDEKDDMHNQILLAAEYHGFLVYYEFVADDYYTYFKNRGRVGYLGKFPKNSIDPVKLKKDKVERHYGFPTTEFALTKQNDAMITYVIHYCNKIYYMELLDDLPKFRPNKRTPSDRTVSAMITLVSSMELVPQTPARKTPIIKTYANPNYHSN